MWISSNIIIVSYKTVFKLPNFFQYDNQYTEKDFRSREL